MKPNTFVRLTVSVGVLSVAAYACSSDPDLSGFGRGLGTGGGAGMPGSTGAGGPAVGIVGGGSATGGSGGSAASAGSGSGGTIVVVTDASMPDAMLEPDAACATGSADASLRPVNMLVMFDRSGSMLEVADEASGATRWDLTSAALTQFFQDPGAADLGVALRFFPHDSPAAGCNKSACDVSACSQVLVDMAKLTADPAPMDVQEGSLVTAVTSSVPMQTMGGNQSGGTPISAALDGALTWATTYQAAHPEEQTVVIFVTDGQPNGCDEDFGTISQIAADALAASGVTTYAIGLQNADGTAISPDDMNRLAAAGGTDKAFFVSDGPTASADLLAALNSIRGMAIACDFPMPTTTSSGMKIDKNLVNVSFTPSGAMPSDLTKVASAADCATSQSWYYDNEAAPTRIVLCPSACDTVTADSAARIEIIVGCAPNIEPPR